MRAYRLIYTYIYIQIYKYILQDISLEKKKSSIYFPETVGRGEMDNLLFYFFVGNILCIFQLRLTVKCDLDIFIGSPLYRWVSISFTEKFRIFLVEGGIFLVSREIAMQAGKQQCRQGNIMQAGKWQDLFPCNFMLIHLILPKLKNTYIYMYMMTKAMAA